LKITRRSFTKKEKEVWVSFYEMRRREYMNIEIKQVLILKKLAALNGS
jgi:hypothetical protein